MSKTVIIVLISWGENKRNTENQAVLIDKSISIWERESNMLETTSDPWTGKHIVVMAYQYRDNMGNLW